MAGEGNTLLSWDSALITRPSAIERLWSFCWSDCVLPDRQEEQTSRVSAHSISEYTHECLDTCSSFVKYEASEGAAKAIKELDGKELMNCHVRVIPLVSLQRIHHDGHAIHDAFRLSTTALVMQKL